MEKEEVARVVEQAISGNWMPFGIVCGCLGVIVVLFIYILKMKEKAINEKHESAVKTTTRSIDKLTEISGEMKTMLAVHDSEINQLKAS